MNAPSLVPLGDVAELRAGVGFPIALQGKSKGDFPFAKVGDISRCARSGAVYMSSSDHYIDCNDLKSIGARPIPEESIIFAKIGEAIRQNYRVLSGCELLIDNNAMAAIPNAKVFSKYLFHYLKTIDFYSFAPSTTVPAIRKSDLQKLLIPMLSIEEQKRVSMVLDCADLLRNKQRAVINRLDDLAQSIYIDIFGDPVNNPKRWPCKRLSDVATFENGDRSSNYPSGSDIKVSGIPFLSTKNIVASVFDFRVRTFISPEKFLSLSRGKVKKGDLIITLRGTLGACCIFECEYPEAFINAQMMIIRPKHEVSSSYLHSLLTMDVSKKRFLQMGVGAAVPQLTAAQLSDLPVPIPPLELQVEYTKKIDSVERLKTFKKNQLAHFDTLFSSLQHRAFRGEL